LKPRQNTPKSAPSEALPARASSPPARRTTLVFPENPAAGQTYNAPSGASYRFDGVVWVHAGDTRAKEREQDRERQAWEQKQEIAHALAVAQAAQQAAEKALAALTTKNSKAPAKLRRAPTWTTVHDWGRIYADIARRCINASGRLAIPQQAALVADMTEWCSETLGRAPHERELRGAVKTICDGLRAGPDQPKKKPSR
jgi:hypothetical protein